MAFKVKIDQDAVLDIQEAINWYNSQQAKLGKKFHSEIKNTFKMLISSEIN